MSNHIYIAVMLSIVWSIFNTQIFYVVIKENSTTFWMEIQPFQDNTDKCEQTTVHQVWFKFVIPAFEWPKTT
jgi:hypothetical protein